MKTAFVLLFIVIAAIFAFIGWDYVIGERLITPSATKQILKKEKPLEKYTFEALSKTKFTPSKITLGEILREGKDFTSYTFYFYVEGKKVSGLVNIPKTEGEYLVVVMFRGYVEKEIYETGMGTKHAGEFLAQNGFITLAPDFLGYGKSDNPSENPIEERFQTYTTALTLLESVGNLNSIFKREGIAARAKSEKIGIWGHSNGGQIALSVLAITGKDYPTVLWAPVSKPFPYSVLYYTDEFDDHGKMLRKVIADFEKDYDVENYSPPNFWDRIGAPMQLHQGIADEAVPLRWSDQLFEDLKKKGKEIEYFTYAGSDHNLLPDGWDLAIQRSISFFRQNLQ